MCVCVCHHTSDIYHTVSFGLAHLSTVVLFYFFLYWKQQLLWCLGSIKTIQVRTEMANALAALEKWKNDSIQRMISWFVFWHSWVIVVCSMPSYQKMELRCSSCESSSFHKISNSWSTSPMHIGREYQLSHDEESLLLGSNEEHFHHKNHSPVWYLLCRGWCIQLHASASLQNIYLRQSRRRASKISRDTTQSNNCLFTKLRSGKHFCCLSARAERFERGFYPQAIRLLITNQQL